MQTAASTVTPLARKKTPPLWFVTNGDVTVGPVTTNLLVRGVIHERVPQDCLVRERTWSAWRHLERIREVAEVRRAQARGVLLDVPKSIWKDPEPPTPAFLRFEEGLWRAQDPGELLRDTLMEVMTTTGAWVGAVHRRRPPQSGLVTTCTRGPGMTQRLGTVLSATDPAVELAARGEFLCEVPHGASASGVVQDRLGAFPSCSGVVMLPVVCFGRLYAMIELGRPDHAFRAGDVDRAHTLAALAAHRIGIVQNRAS